MKKKELKLRHSIVINIVRPFAALYFKIKYRYNYQYQKGLKNKGPFLVLGNHTVPVDPFLMGFSFPFHLYYFATEQIFNLGLISKLLVWAVNPIKKSKSISDLAAIRKARNIVKEGGSIAIFPEGNVTYDGQTATINPSIVKLIRLLNIPVLFHKTEGLYLTNPRWGIFSKKGKSRGYISNHLTPETFQNMNDDELIDFVNKELYVNAYEDQQNSKQEFKGKQIALGLERLVFMDLKINKPFVTYTKNNQLLSKESDFKLTYLTNGQVLYNGIESTLVEINKQVLSSYVAYLNNSHDEFLYEERAHISISSTDSKTKKIEKTFKLFKDSLYIDEEKVGFNEITNMAIQGKNKLIIYVNDITYLISLSAGSSPYKFLVTYQWYQQNELGEQDGKVYKLGL